MQFDNYSIRPLEKGDLEPYFQVVEKNRKRLEDFFTGTTSRTKTFEDTRLFVDDMLERAKNRSFFPYLIIDNSNGNIAGFLDLKNVDWTIPKSEIGCWMDSDYAGSGIASTALRMFCDFCFEEYGFRKLFLRTHHSNLPARRIAEKAGFEIEGTIRCDYKKTSGEIVDSMYYGKLRT